MKTQYYFLTILAFAASLIYDRQILIAIESIRAPLLTSVFEFFSTAGTYIPIPLLILSAVMLHKKTGKQKITAVWLASLAALVGAYAIKYLVNRPRPDFVQALLPETSPAFPSAHASVSFAPIPILTKWLKAIWVPLAILISLSRVYLGVHYTSDIIAGALIGYLIGHSFSKINFSRVKLLKKLKIA